MEIFSYTPHVVYLEDIEFSTHVSESYSGKDKTRNQWPTGTINNETQGYAKRTFRLEFNPLLQTEYAGILRFFSRHIGRKTAFYFENYNESPISALFPSNLILTNNYQGENTTQLPHYPIIGNSQTIYDDGVALVEGVGYSIDDSTGVITWISKPANGSIITADYRFYRQVRFLDDKLSPQYLSGKLYHLQALVKEIEPRL